MWKLGLLFGFCNCFIWFWAGHNLGYTTILMTTNQALFFFMHVGWPHFVPIVHRKNFSTLSSPLRSFTTGMVAGTSNWNISEIDLSKPLHEASCRLASTMAALVAQ
ncbi:hypothetical protein V6Z11_A05G081700 [Gossypium hirsutum]